MSSAKESMKFNDIHAIVGGLNIYQKIGEGKFGVIRHCSKKDSKDSLIKKLCVKIIDREQINKIEREIEISMNMNHINLVNYIDSFVSMNHCYVVMEFCSNNSLRSYIVTQKERINSNEPLKSTKESLNIIRQIVNGFHYLYNERVIHRDIKPENIMLTKEKIVKIGDFGFGKLIAEMDELLNHTRVGTPCYSAPQILLGEKFSSKCDVWSCGVLFYEVLFAKLPFENSWNIESKNFNFGLLLQGMKKMQYSLYNSLFFFLKN